MDDSHLVECGRIGRPIGLKGDCLIRWNNGKSPVEVGGRLFVATKGNLKHITCQVAALRKQGRLSVVRFEGVDDRASAGKLRGATVYVPASGLNSLPDGEYYSYQILGLAVFTEDGNKLGKIVKIFTAGESDVYEVMPEGGRRGDEILIPAIEDVILSVDLSAGRMTVRLMDGMGG